MKALVRFFRNRAINAYRKTRKTCFLPDVSKHPAVAVIIDEAQLSNVKDLITAVNRYFAMGKCSVFVSLNAVSCDAVYGDDVHVITKNDFGMFGILNDDVKSSMSSVAYDLLVNFCNSDDDNKIGDYLSTYINSTFRVSFNKSSQPLYDLVIGSKKDDVMEKLTVLSVYLTMLSGK